MAQRAVKQMEEREREREKHAHNLSQHALLPRGVMFKRKQNDERLAKGDSTHAYIKLWHRERTCFQDQDLLKRKKLKEM